MDSLMAVEIKQALEREFDVTLTAQDLRVLTFAKLQELTDAGSKGNKIAGSAEDKAMGMEDVQKNLLLRSLGHEQMADKIIMPLNDKMADRTKENDTYALFIPGVEGVISPVLYTLCKNIDIPIYALQLHSHCREESYLNLTSSISKVSKLGHISYLLNIFLNINNLYNLYYMHRMYWNCSKGRKSSS